jgi:hypothetical protein
MSALADKPIKARHRDGRIFVTIERGLQVAFAVAGNPRLDGKSHQQLNRIHISPFGPHWPDLDEDVSLKGILAGEDRQRKRRAA